MPCLHSALSACWPPCMAATQSSAACMHAYPNLTLPYPLLWLRAQLTRQKAARPTRAGEQRRGGRLRGGRRRQRVRGGHRASGGGRQRRLRHLLQPREDERHHLRQHRARRLRQQLCARGRPRPARSGALPVPCRTSACPRLAALRADTPLAKVPDMPQLLQARAARRMSELSACVRFTGDAHLASIAS